MNERGKHIVVVGRDVAGWLTGLAMQRALADHGVRVTMLELPSLAVQSDVVTAVPSLSQLNQMLGIDAMRLLRACNGVPMVGQQFANWARSATSFMHAYDTVPAAEIEFSFVDYWVKARQHGLRVPFEDFSPGAAAAKQGRVPASDGFDADLPKPSFGYQLDAQQYASALKQLAVKSGVDHRTGKVQHIRRSSRRIESLIWDEGETFEADVFVDASGSEATLIKVLEGSEIESWHQWFPADRMLSGSAPPLRPLPAFAQITAFRGGWLGIHPLQDRTAVVGAYASDIADREMLMNLPMIAGIAISGELVTAPFSPGVRRQPWIGNCVAVGAAAAELEPLDSALIHFLHFGIAHLVAELTNIYASETDRVQYNRTIVQQAESIRDFQLVHYRHNGRFDEVFWDRARQAGGPYSLEGKIAAFRDRGSIPVAPEEPFRETNWAAALIGHGVVPERFAPWAEQIGKPQHTAILQDRLRWIAEMVRAMPTVNQFLQLEEAVDS